VLVGVVGVQLGVDLNFGGMCACSLVARVVDRHPHHDNTNDLQEAVCVLPGVADPSPLGPLTLSSCYTLIQRLGCPLRIRGRPHPGLRRLRGGRNVHRHHRPLQPR
jgi:hypothetical protein